MILRHLGEIHPADAQHHGLAETFKGGRYVTVDMCGSTGTSGFADRVAEGVLYRLN